MLGGLCFAEMGAMLPKAGGMTVYLNTAFHPLVGFLNGFNSWLLSGAGSLAAGALAFSAIFGLTGTTGKLVASALMIVFIAYNMLGIKAGRCSKFHHGGKTDTDCDHHDFGVPYGRRFS